MCASGVSVASAASSSVGRHVFVVPATAVEVTLELVRHRDMRTIDEINDDSRSQSLLVIAI